MDDFGSNSSRHSRWQFGVHLLAIMGLRCSELEQAKLFNSFGTGVDESGDQTLDQWTEPRSDHSMRPDWRCL
jgi:hypothetical protein